jgi:hypothetical protein
MREPIRDADPRTVAADLFERFHGPVLERLRRERAGVDRDLLHDAFVQALLQVSAHGERFDRRRGSAFAFLLGATRRSLGGLLRRERRRRRREEKKAGAVTRDASADRPVLEELADRELAGRLRAEIARTAEEGRALDLWLAGEADPDVYARELGLGDWPQARRRAHVGRLLARLRQRLSRAGRRLRAEEPRA